MIDWETRFEALPDVEQDKLALLRVIECTNGVIQHSYRNGDDDTLTVDEVREAMKFSMGCMKRQEIPVGDKIVTFAPETKELMTEMRRLYISGQKQNNQEDFNEFLKGSKPIYLRLVRNVFYKPDALHLSTLMNYHLTH